MLNRDQKKHLRALAHKIKPVVTIGQKGLTDAVTNEVEIALDAHELVKIKITGADRDDKKAFVARLCDQCKADEVQQIGNVATLFRRNPDKPKVLLPKG